MHRALCTMIDKGNLFFNGSEYVDKGIAKER